MSCLVVIVQWPLVMNQRTATRLRRRCFYTANNCLQNGKRFRQRVKGYILSSKYSHRLILEFCSWAELSGSEKINELFLKNLITRPGIITFSDFLFQFFLQQYLVSIRILQDVANFFFCERQIVYIWSVPLGIFNFIRMYSSLIIRARDLHYNFAPCK